MSDTKKKTQKYSRVDLGNAHLRKYSAAWWCKVQQQVASKSDGRVVDIQEFCESFVTHAFRVEPPTIATKLFELLVIEKLDADP